VRHEPCGGVSYPDFTPEGSKKIIDKLSSQGYKKTIDAAMVFNVGLNRSDLWVSNDGKWQVKVDYKIIYKTIDINNITISIDIIDYGFEN
jgi:hypothetical protein